MHYVLFHNYLNALLTNLYDSDIASWYRSVDGGLTIVTDSSACLRAIDAVNADGCSCIDTLNVNSAFVALNQNCFCRNFGHTICNAFCLRLLVYPTERGCGYIAVVVARFGGINANVIRSSERDCCTVVFLNVYLQKRFLLYWVHSLHRNKHPSLLYN